tara:strand:+ start:308 stop:526 length:219 start_codon:yes stop_codon:yes gene_type:complete
MLYTTDAATARQMIPNIMLAFKYLMYILSGSSRSSLVVGKWLKVGEGWGQRLNVEVEIVGSKGPGKKETVFL